jgi:hypothetical protein
MAPALREPLVGGASLFHRPLGQQLNDSVHLLVNALDLFEVRTLPYLVNSLQ